MDRILIRQEAIKRLSDMTNETITMDNFDDMIPVSMQIENMIKCIKLNNERILKDIKDNFEKRTGAIVYYCILSSLGFGYMLSLLYVSPYEEDWDYERLNESNVVANVYNFDDDTEEIGSIGIKQISDGKWIRFY